MSQNNVANLNREREDDGQDEEELDAEQYRDDLAGQVGKQDILDCFEQLDAIEEKRAELIDKKKSVVQVLVDKGCHRQGVLNAWQRHSKPKRQQAKIDATFKVACELAGRQGDLFAEQSD